MTIEGSSKDPKRMRTGRLSSPFDTKIVQKNGNDLIVVSTIISMFLLERILVNDGNVIKVLI